MRLLLLGAPRPLTTNRWKNDVEEAAEALGWVVTHLPADAIHVDDVVAQAATCDLMLWARTHGHNPVGGPVEDMLRRIEDAGTVTAGLHLDLYWGIPRREAQIGVDPWWSQQWVFTADGGFWPWAARGVNHVWCPPAAGLRFHGRGLPAARYMQHRVAFVGRVVKGIHGPHRERLVAWAARRWAGRFGLYGRSGMQVWGAELSALCASARAIVADSAESPFYWSDRVPIMLGRGGVLAHPRTPGFVEQGFGDDCMILYDRYGFAELGDRIDSMTSAQLRQMADNAVTVVGERHLWTHRLRYVARVVGLS